MTSINNQTTEFYFNLDLVNVLMLILLLFLSIWTSSNSLYSKFIQTTRQFAVKSTEIRHQNEQITTETIDSMNFFIENHGCQMNLADSDVVRSILLSNHHKSIDDIENADLILINTW